MHGIDRLIRHEAGRTAWLIEPDTTFELRRIAPMP